MEGERCGECMGCLSATGREFEVVAEKFAVHWMGTVVDYDVGTLYRVESAKVGDTLVCDYDVYRVFGMIHVRHHGDNIGDFAFLGDGRA